MRWQRSRQTHADYRVNLFWGRQCVDVQAALAYSFFLMTQARTGTYQETDFISEEQNRIRFRSMKRHIETTVYESAAINSQQKEPLLLSTKNSETEECALSDDKTEALN